MFLQQRWAIRAFVLYQLDFYAVSTRHSSFHFFQLTTSASGFPAIVCGFPTVVNGVLTVVDGLLPSKAFFSNSEKFEIHPNAQGKRI
jgi:hypothetical protein